MLFKNTEGIYVELRRNQFTTDTAYYTSIMKVKGTAKVKANRMGTNEMVMNVNEMGANEMGTDANEVGANEVGANEVGANENEMVMNENAIGTNTMVINEMDRIRSLIDKTLKHI